MIRILKCAILLLLSLLCRYIFSEESFQLHLFDTSNEDYKNAVCNDGSNGGNKTIYSTII